jgi:hypothetical protein
MSKRALAVLLIGCGVLGMQSLPAAAGAKSSAGSTLTSASETVSSATRKAERAAAKAESAPPPPPPVQQAPPPPPPLAHGHHGQTDVTADAPSAAARHEERAHRREAQTQPAASATGAGAGVAPVSGEAAAGEAEALARKTKKSPEEKKRAKKEHKEKAKGKKGGTPPEEEATQGSGGEGAEVEGGSGANVKSKTALSAQEPAQAAVAAALSLPAATPAPTSGTGSASITSSPPAAKAGLDAAATAHRASGRAGRRGHKRAAQAVAAVAAPVGVAATAPSGATHGASARPAKRAGHPSTQPALVKTLTKIVGVVPTPVRILIGALIVLALLLAARSLLSGARTRRLLRQRGQLLEDVGLLQAALLPTPPARLGPLATSVAYRPADGPGAGGDFYDVFALADGEIAVILGDVSGHGREALPHTALLRFTVRAYLEAGMPPRRALQTAGEVLERQLGGSFATVLAATYNPRERTLTYASAGHPPPVVLGEDASALAMATACSAPPIGTGVRTGTRETVVSVPGPARLCFHTDGVTEARVEGDLFGSERLAATLAGLGAEADAAALLEDVVARTDARPDDMAACLLRVLDGEGAPAVVLEQLELGRGLVVPAERARVERFLAGYGVAGGEARELLDDACERLEHVSTVLLQVSRDGARTVASLLEDNVIHAPALAMAGAS